MKKGETNAIRLYFNGIIQIIQARVNGWFRGIKEEMI
jgi:hypothetical protein